jgi:thiol:disulfide interchange protein DsbD
MRELVQSMYANRSARLCAAVSAFVLVLLTLLAPAAHAADDFLEPDIAFKFSAKRVDATHVNVTFAIADGYYMYRERFAFSADGAKLGVAVLPPGKIKYDATFKKDVETYRKAVTINLPVEAQGPFTLKVTSQGCADKGLCYAPMESQIRLSMNGGSGLLEAARGAFNGNVAMDTPQSQAAMSMPPVDRAPMTGAPVSSEMGQIETALKSGRLLIILPLFAFIGLGLSFTPCVLPMMPILSSIIVGEGAQVRRRRGFMLAATYALGMALVYTLLGVAAGLIGEGLSAALQRPWVLVTFALLIIALSLSMFGVYQLQMPASFQARLIRLSNRQAAGKLAGVFLMGALSALIVSPCVTGPLAAVLVFISQSRDVVIGGSALFAMSVGMSVPLLLIGLSAGSLLPRVGPWMESVKRFFGVLMLGVALWMISPLLPIAAQMFAWAALGIAYGAFLLWPNGAGWPAKAAGLAFVALGGVQLIGAATGGRDVLAPLAHLMHRDAQKIPFTRINSSAELDAALAQAGRKPVLLDFYADWCVSCKEMEKLTFSDPRVQNQLAQMVLLQADVTQNNAEDKALLKRFRLFGPPGILFFTDGREVSGTRVIGFQSSDEFLRSLAAVHH